MEKINLVELLKDCPKGMELDSAMYNEVKLISVDESEDTIFPIKVCREDGLPEALTKYGQYLDLDFAKCIIFPKGKTTWKGFQRPFKDGDVVYIRNTFKWVAIYKELEKGRNEIGKYASIRLHSRFNNTYLFDDRPLCHNKDVNEIRFASEKEKQILFDAIKENGYQWNAETKTLQKVITLKFKIGDKIKLIGKNTYALILGIRYEENEVYYETLVGDISIKDQDNYELVPNKFDITTLNPFESRVLVRDCESDQWSPAIWGFKSDDIDYPYVVVSGNIFNQCIPYESNEHLLGKADDCDEYYKIWE